MATRARRTQSKAVQPSIVLYIHGIGEQPPPEAIKREWDLALFGRDVGDKTKMAYWSDVLHPRKGTATTSRIRAASIVNGVDLEQLLSEAGVDPDQNADALAEGLMRAMGVQTANRRTKILPLPGFLRKPIARKFLESLIKDTAAYFFRPGARRKIQRRLIDTLPVNGEPVTIVAHSQGSVIALEVLAELARTLPIRVEHFITIGSPLGITEVQDFLSFSPIAVPKGIARWHNFADPLDPVALDKGLLADFDGEGIITDELVLNTSVRRLEGFNPHSALGYLAHPKVRKVVQDAARLDMHERFLVARDVVASMAVEERQPVLIEILEPGFNAVGETPDQMREFEKSVEQGTTNLSDRVKRTADYVSGIVEKDASRLNVDPKKAIEDARIDPLRRFVAARLTPAELSEVAHRHRDLRIYAIWKSSLKRTLLNRSARVIQADAAWASYGAYGQDIRWAILDTGIRRDHPHFRKHNNIIEVWDCTEPGKPKAIPKDRDHDGHGTHTAGIVAGSSPDKYLPQVHGIARKAKLVVYKVLNDLGEGEDAWIIKALDHIAEQNENNSEILTHGINLSLGGPYDSTVYGCGFSPVCVELRRQWRSGVLVVVACGNEGQIDVKTPDGETELNTPMSIGDPANLEDCIAVGSVNADRPHLYGVSAFSSRGPTSDGRPKPDVVAPGERITSCDAHFRSASKGLYRKDSGTSMAAPHVSGLLAAFLSVRREFRGRPDEVKALLLRTCIDIGRDRYHQGRGIPNLMRMLLEA